MIELILFGTFFVLLGLGVPVAFSLGLAAVATIAYDAGLDQLSAVPSVMFASLSSETLLAIPFFILAGAIMEYAGISARLIDFADAAVGKFKHGLAMVVVISAFFFSAISGSGPATVAAIGSILIPALIRRGYAKRHAASMVAASGSMGIVVPPSIAFIIFAVVVAEYERVSIGRLFIAGIVPGILMAIALITAAFFLPRAMPTATKVAQPATAGADGTTSGAEKTSHHLGAGAYTAPEDEPYSEAESEVAEHVGDGSARQHWLGAFLRAIPGLLVPVIILGGIYGGIFTPTESAVVASVYALIVGLFIYRDIKVTGLTRVFTVAAVQSAVVMLIVGCASIFAYVITRQQVALTVSDALLGITENKYLILLIVMVLLLIVGMFVDAVSALYLFVPLLAPVLLAVGVDVTTMGVLMVVNLAVGMITPPVGVNLFVAAGIADAPLSEVVKGIMPFLGAVLFVLVLVTFIPALSNWLPDLLGV